MRWLRACVLITLTGCHAYYADIDAQINQRAAAPVDAQPSFAVPPAKPVPELETSSVGARFGKVTAQRDVVRTSFESQPEKDKDKKGMLERLQVPEAVLGYKVADIPPPPPKATPEEKKKWLAQQFPPLLAVPPLPRAKVGPNGQPLALSDLQQIALTLNPTIRQAHQDIDAARGIALQAKLYPNPLVGYEGTTVGQGNPSGDRSPGQQGGFIQQDIPTAGKLTLAHEAALRDVEIAELRLKLTEVEVQSQVRRRYFEVLSAQKTFDTTAALAQLIDELYNVMLLQFQIGEVAAYEPMQIRVLALQARGNLVQAHNRYVRAWKQLAATLGTPEEPLTALAGQIDMSVPHFDHDAVLAYVLTNHSDVRAAQANVDKMRFLARLEEVQPYPNPTVRVAFQKDFTTPPFGFVANVGVGVPVPLWSRNQGHIQAARASLGKAVQETQRVHNDLTSRVAEVFERYESNRTLLKMYKQQILPNQVQAFRASVARHAAVQDKAVSYNDLVVSQQTLSNLINSYLTTLNEQWISVVDIAQLLQTRDLFQMQPMDEVAPIPDMPALMRERFLHR